MAGGNHASAGYEAGLGNPGVSGYVLSSTTAGERSWVLMTGGTGGVSASEVSNIVRDSLNLIRTNSVAGVKLHPDTLLVTTAGHTLTLADDGRLIRARRATMVTITIPSHTSVALPLGATVNIKMDSTGIVKFVYPTGYLCSELDSVCINNKGGWATLIKRANNKWDLMGSLLN